MVKRALWLIGLAVVVTLFWWILPELAPRWTWAIDRAMACISLGLLAALFVERVTLDIEYLCSYHCEYSAPRVLVTM